MGEVSIKQIEKNGFVAMANRIQSDRNEEWQDAWDYYDISTLADITIGKILRAKNKILMGDNEGALNELMDGFNYAWKAKERAKENEGK